MKKIIFILLMFVSSLGYSQTSLYDGNWVDDNIWKDGTAPSTTIGWGDVVNIESVVTADVVIEVEWFGTLNVNSDSLIINAGLVTFIGGKVFIDTDAILYIDGDLGNTWWGDIIVNGTLLVTGDVDNIGSNVVVNGGGSIGVGGNFNNNGGNVINDGEIIVGGVVTGDTIDNSGGGTVVENDPLPIELLHFTPYYDFDKSVLTWATASEINNDYFIIEYAIDGVLWEVLDYVQGAGNSSAIINYNYSHYTKKSYYYRLTQVDYDGSNETFDIIFVQSIYIDMDRVYDVYDTNGKLIQKGKTSDIQDLKTGVYFLKNNTEVHKILID